MPHSEKYDYAKYRRITGKVQLDNNDHETIAKLTVDGHDFDFISKYIAGLTREEYDTLQSDLLFQRRVDYLRTKRKRDKLGGIEKTPDEYISSGLKRLDYLSKNGGKEDKSKVDAAKALVQAAAYAKKASREKKIVKPEASVATTKKLGEAFSE